ncbi:SatD family protein [Myroides odoratimimus]|uniref:SatD family protein n=1 Tax=Myroides odoratimimus TaxID=76832 RepID=UPI002DBECA1F|nr:SatD family protein [Myroides odoratimimus]MEC4052078.1 SatD family protein [Myroides odoratimimus]
MIAVITGDIVNSRSVDPKEWQPQLKAFLEKSFNDVSKWEIYRGDSFQIEIAIEKALEFVLMIKALIKHISNLNVRMSIGIGEQGYISEKVIESYGQAFINSGQAFEELKDKTLRVKTNNKEFDDYFNPILGLVSFITDQWKPETAKAFFYTLYYNDLLQKEVAVKMGKNSTTISRALKRGASDELLNIIKLYSNKVKLCLT